MGEFCILARRGWGKNGLPSLSGHRPLATMMLLTKQIVSTGTQIILSQKLGVIALAIIPTPQYATTTHMSFLEIGCHAGKTSPTRINVVIIKAKRRNADAADAARILAGRTPG